MAAHDLMMRLQLQLQDRVLKPMQRMAAGSRGAARALQATRDRLRDLERTQTLIQRLRQQQDAFKNLSNQLKIHQANLNSMRISGTATAAQMRTQTALVDRTTAAFNKQRTQLALLRTQATNAGIGKLSTDEARLGAEITRTTARLTQQENALRRMNAARAQRREGLTQAATIGATGLGMYYTGRRALTGAFNFIQPGIEFDENMSRVQALTGLSRDSEQLTRLRQQADDLGASTMFSAVEAAQGQQFLAMASYKPDDILAAMPALLDLALAGKTDLGRTADIVSNVAGGFGIQAPETARVADVLSAATNNANVTLDMLGETMQYVAPVARAAGVSLEDSTAMAAMLGNVGIQGSSAGTQLRTMLTRLSTKGGEVLAGLGIEAKDSEGNLRDVTELLFEMDRATQHMGSADRLAILNDVFDQRAMSGGDVLLQQIANGKLQEFAEMLRNSQGTAATTARTMTDNVTGDLDEVSSAFDGIRISVNELITQDLRGFLKGLAQLLGSAREWIKENPEIVKWIARIGIGIAALSAGIGGLLMAIAPMLAGMAMFRFAMFALTGRAFGLIGVITKVIQVIGFLANFLIANPLFAALALLAVAAYLIYKNWDSFAWFFTDLWDQVTAAFDEGIWGIGRLILNWSPLGLFYKAFAVVMDYFGITLPENFTTFAWDMMQSFGAGIVEHADMLRGWFGELFDGLINWLLVVLPGQFRDIGSRLMFGLIEGFMSMLNWAKDKITGVVNYLNPFSENELSLASPTYKQSAPIMRSSGGSGARSYTSNDTYNLSVDGTGMSQDQVQGMVERAIVNVQCKREARARSSYIDA